MNMVAHGILTTLRDIGPPVFYMQYGVFNRTENADWEPICGPYAGTMTIIKQVAACENVPTPTGESKSTYIMAVIFAGNQMGFAMSNLPVLPAKISAKDV